MFLTPGGDPFWGGTYFPREPRFGRPGFVAVLEEVARVFHAEPDRVAHNQSYLKKTLSQQGREVGAGSLSMADLNQIGCGFDRPF